MVQWRRTLHQNPELGFKEERTAALVAEELRRAGLDEVRTGVAGTGVVGVLRAPNRPHSGALLLRADMDALPIQEENPHLDFASRVPDVMHACGHDGHTAILLAAAHAAAAARGQLSGDLVFVFQPAEEGPGGALPMIKEGVLEQPRVRGAVGLHIDTHQPVGRLQTGAGPVMAAADEFTLRIVGRGGHGAYPHQAVDAVVAGSQVVTALQTLVSRDTNPAEKAVVTTGSFHSGHNFNIIAEEAQLRGTVRTFDPALRDHLKRRIGEVARGVCDALGARCEYHYEEHYPPVVNDAAMSDRLVRAAEPLFGREAIQTDLLSMGGEDMAYFLREVPGVFFFLGARNEATGCHHSMHSPHFDFDEEALPLGAEIFLRFAEAFFE
ncbi:MAG: amidohydrolase [Candidatus Eisenbacteria bacterium]|nr:amidohydrolase [Candidatus Eisenbacteria bacterium]